MAYWEMPVSHGDMIVYVPGGVELHVVSADGRRYKGVARVEGYMGDRLLTLSGNTIETFHVT